MVPIREIGWVLSEEIRWSQSRKSAGPNQRKSRTVETTYANRGGSGGSCKIAIGINREYGHTSVGWVVNPVSAGFVAGLLAALAGVSMLELHCSNFQTLHVLVWHTLVVPVSGAIGAFLGWVVSEYVSDGR